MTVDTKRLRELIKTAGDAHEAFAKAVCASNDLRECGKEMDACGAAQCDLIDAVDADLPALLDEIDAARALLSEVLPSVDSGAVGHRWTGECSCAACRATALLSPDRAPAASLES